VLVSGPTVKESVPAVEEVLNKFVGEQPLNITGGSFSWLFFV
jgi:hypothetical protein